MANQYRLGNRQNEESSPVREARHLRYMWAINSSDNHVASSTSAPRLFGSSLNMNPTIGAQAGAGAGPAAPAGAGSATGHNYQRSGVAAGNNSIANSILSFNGGINTTTTAATTTTTTTGTRRDDRRRANSSLKRSRTPNAINRGESSSQGSQADGNSSRRLITFPPSPIHAHQDNTNNMSSSSSSSSTFWRNYSGGNSSISTMFNQNTMNEVAAAGAGPSNTINQSQMNSVPRGPTSFFEDDNSISYHNSSHYEFGTEPFNILRLLHRQEHHPWTNFNAGRHNPSPASASFQYPSAATGGEGGSSSRSTGWGRNYDNNLDIFDTIHEQRMNEEYVESTSWGRFLNPTNVAGRPSSSVPPRRPPQSSDPSPSNYRRNPPPPPPPRSENPTRPSGSNRISISTSPELRAERITLREELFSTLQHLRNGGSARIEDLLILDYSIVLNLLDSQELIDQLNDSEDWPYEIISALERQVGNVETGLTQQEISRYILQETYQVNLEETCTLNQTCTICQEDYVEGERIGKVDCMHIFHLDCIKQWLEEKNVCPICKQTALEIDESESEDE